MENKDNAEQTNQKETQEQNQQGSQPKIQEEINEQLVISEMQEESVKLIFMLFKILVESYPNDADLGKEFRILFEKIKYD